MPLQTYSSSPINASNAGSISPKPEEAKPTQPTPTTPTPANLSRTRYLAAQPGACPAGPTPTRTMGTSTGSPPLPQAVSIPPNPSFNKRTTALPPPPKATSPPSHTATASYPAQMAIPPPAVSYPVHHQRGTSTADPSLNPGPAPCTLAHPPGYQQNVRAVDFSSNQRASHDALRRSGGFENDDEEGWWNTAKKLAAGAGEKLSAAESEVWRRINKDD